MHTLRQLKALDTIIYNEDTRQTIHSLMTNLNCVVSILPVLNEGVVRIEDASPTEKTYLYFKDRRMADGTNLIHLEHYLYNKLEYTTEFLFKGAFSYADSGKGRIRIETLEWQGIYAKMPLEKQRGFFVDYANIYSALTAYLAYLSLASVAKQHPATRAPRAVRPSGAANENADLFRKRSEVVIQGIRFITDNPDILVRRVKKGIVRHVESWTVRGHYRHLKSGKDVFVKAHRKGNQAAAAKGKLYRLDSAVPVQ